MKYIYFVEINGIKHYKVDTFWYKTTDISKSKVYSNIHASLVTSYTQNISYLYEDNPGRYAAFYRKCNNLCMGYQILEEDQINPDNQYILIDNPVPTDTVYLFTMNLYEDGTNELIDYKKTNRENKIKKLLKK